MILNNISLLELIFSLNIGLLYIIACIISQPPNTNNIIDEIIDKITEISTMNLVFHNPLSNLFSIILNNLISTKLIRKN